MLSGDEDGGILEVANLEGYSVGRMWVDNTAGGLLTLNDPLGYRLLSLFSDADGGIATIENVTGFQAANLWATSYGDGLLTLNDSEGYPRVNLFGDPVGGNAQVENWKGQIAGHFWVGDEGGGLLNLNDPDGNFRAVLSVLSTGSGDLRLDGPNGNENVSLASTNGNDNRGVISVSDPNGTPRAQLYVDSNNNGQLFLSGAKNANTAGAGIDSEGRGILWANQTYSVEDHPNKSGSKIVYSSLEGPEAAIFIRGKVNLDQGKAVIELPEEFTALAVPDTLTVQLTPGSIRSKGVAFEKIDSQRIRIGELAGGTGSYEVHYTVYARRLGYENQKTVMNEKEFQQQFTKGSEVAKRLQNNRHSSPIKKSPPQIKSAK